MPMVAEALKKINNIEEIAEEDALENLLLFKEKWDKEYSSTVRSWEENVVKLS